MINSIKYLFAIFIAMNLVGCGIKTNPKLVNPKKISSIHFEGNYVSEGYEKKHEGYDWVAVTVVQTGDSTYHLRIRSRMDIKKPTCTFDAEAKKLDSSRLVTFRDGKNILFSFKDSSLVIKTENPEDILLLNYFCSGGGSIAGNYRKIRGSLDDKQIDPRVFIKLLTLQNIGFEISSAGTGSFQQLTIIPFGLTIDNQKIATEIEGTVTDAEIEDLNADGFPEILVYTTSAGSGSYGNVIGYSVNNGKSLSQIYLPEITDDPNASKGYMGMTSFALWNPHWSGDLEFTSQPTATTTRQEAIVRSVTNSGRVKQEGNLWWIKSPSILQTGEKSVIFNFRKQIVKNPNHP